MCAIFGVFGLRKAAELTVIGLHGNQHRARHYAGIVSSDGSNLYRERGEGLARKVFTAQRLKDLPGTQALGHIRYPTVTDDEALDNAQPILGRYIDSTLAIAHNGNITNTEELRKLIPSSALSTSMDTEYILRLLEQHHSGDIEADLSKVFALLKGSFTLGILLNDRLIGVRDKSGNRPLSIGILNDGYCISSETCVFPNLGALHYCDVEPGTMVSIGADGLRVIRFAIAEEMLCRFEGIYFSHPASRTFGEEISEFRWNLGRALEKHAPVMGGADLVTPIPDSSNFIACGYSQSGRSGNFFPVIMRNHYVGRTFIEGTQSNRDIELASKFTYAAGIIKGKRIVVVDDSIVRGTTLPTIVRVIRELGAKAVHVRIGSPPITHSCKYGINTPTSTELLAARMTPSQICSRVGADSLEFLPLEVLKELSPERKKFCFACMNGEYWDR